MFAGDLHNHTTASDGEYSPRDLVSAAVRMNPNLEALGVTDHDTLAGLREAAEGAEGRRVAVVPGVEVSLRFVRPYFVGTLHYLLYVPRSLVGDRTFLEDAERTLSAARGPALNAARVAAINRHFCCPSGVLESPLTVEEVSLGGSVPNVTRRHFANALKARGMQEEQVMKLIGNSSPAYVPSGMEMSELAPLLRKYPSLVRVLAHPAAGSFPGQSHYKEVLPPVETVEKLLPEIVSELGLDGLEVEYPGHTEELRSRLRSTWLREREWIVTGGSDCHDSVSRPLGTAGVSSDQLRSLLSRLN